MIRQRTLKNTIRATGVGLHSGEKVYLTLKPAPVDTGIIFRRTDLDPMVEIRACAENVGETMLSTTLVKDGVRVATVEHLLSAMAGLGIDNCFVEQKNDMAVRRSVGYYRFDTEEEFVALQSVYRHLCPLLNFYYPSVRIIAKERIGSKIKKIYDEPKPPYVRLLESPKADDAIKKELKTRERKLHIMKQKRLVDLAVAELLRIYEKKKKQTLEI